MKIWDRLTTSITYDKKIPLLLLTLTVPFLTVSGYDRNS
jgi:hypothetical protein